MLFGCLRELVDETSNLIFLNEATIQSAPFVTLGGSYYVYLVVLTTPLSASASPTTRARRRHNRGV